MRVFSDAWREEELPRGGVVTVGNFDGVHLGQKALIGRVVERAREAGVPALAVTFEPHPLAVLRPDSAPPRLLTDPQKRRELAACGVDALLVVRFDHELAATPARVFVEDFLFGRLDAREIWVGSGFVFGRDREGDLELLATAAAARGRIARGLDEVRIEGRRVSSTRVRAAVSAGDVELAARLLGRPYEIAGDVVGGARRGRKVGWPTINVAPANELMPTHGVYLTRTRLDGDELPSVTNVGVRPTLYVEGELTVETHLLDFDGDLYGRRVSLLFDGRLRGERRFANVAELAEQIGRDVEGARDFYGLNPAR